MKTSVIFSFYLQPNKKYHYLIIGTFCYKRMGKQCLYMKCVDLLRTKLKKR